MVAVLYFLNFVSNQFCASSWLDNISLRTMQDLFLAGALVKKVFAKCHLMLSPFLQS